jgi:hypothetical protein
MPRANSRSAQTSFGVISRHCSRRTLPKWLAWTALGSVTTDIVPSLNRRRPPSTPDSELEQNHHHPYLQHTIVALPLPPVSRRKQSRPRATLFAGRSLTASDVGAAEVVWRTVNNGSIIALIYVSG